jgi:alpha-D-xyloside xylohydrolase
MPYVYAQAKLCSQEGYPMLRTLFFEYPEDTTSWLIEDEYMFGENILVAPLMEDVPERLSATGALDRLPERRNL